MSSMKIHQQQTESLLKRLLAFISSIFIVELVLGFNGKLIIIGGIPIRMIIYVMLFLILLSLLIHAAKYRQIVIFDSNHKHFIGKFLNKFDLIILIFLMLNAFWVFFVPNITGYGMNMAVKQTISMSILLLYFPIIVLIRIKYINWAKSHYIIKLAIFFLSLLHIVLYIGETVFKDATFAIKFFELINTITFNHTQRPKVMYPLNYFKIIYPNSLFLILVFYYTLKDRLSINSIVFYVIGLTALLTTLTKSLWFGVGGGLILVSILYLFINRKNLIKFHFGKIVTFVIITIISSFLLNTLLFNHYISARLNSTFAVQNAPQQKFATISNNLLSNEMRAPDELAGTERANLTRVIQTKKLLHKWLQSPWIGFGYGSFADDYLRSNKSTPYLYEMLLPSLLMQLGIIGVAVWLAFFIFIIVYTVKVFSKKKGAVLAVSFNIFAVGIASQFNPFLLGASSMGILLFSLIQLQQYNLTE